MYQFACNTIEGLRDMVGSKEDAVLRYQQMIVVARETHLRDRRVLEAEIRIFIHGFFYILFVCFLLLVARQTKSQKQS
jgi:hypothetical protein